MGAEETKPNPDSDQGQQQPTQDPPETPPTPEPAPKPDGDKVDVTVNV